MLAPISALEHKPSDLVREVSPEAIAFYVDELSGLYLPDDFREEHGDRFDVEYWKAEDRLQGKFGRFTLKHAEEDSGAEEEPLHDILVMGTTIGLSGLDRDGDMESLRHYQLRSKVREIFRARDLLDKNISVDEVDYGATNIRLEGGIATTVSISGASYDYGRANAGGRQETCDVFTQLLGEGVEVLNSDPEPDRLDRTVG